MKGILLINLGTPDHCDPKSVRRYLTEFLNDPLVIDLPAIVRWFLVNCLVIPRRYKNSAEAYQQIWLTGDSPLGVGSPLFVYSHGMKEALSLELGAGYQVELGMRYGNPSIQTALEKLQDCDTLSMLPLFPQYASASTGSAIAAFLKIAAKFKQWDISKVFIQDSFYEDPGFFAAYAAVVQKHIQEDIQNKTLDMLLLSYHGLPERQLLKIPAGMLCYQTQCFATSDALANVLGLSKHQYRVSFQSRLGRTPWIKPYTDFILPELIEQGIRNIAVACPSFVADCLETLEEIKIRAREQWESLGGNRFIFIPCLNTEPLWITAMAKMIG